MHENVPTIRTRVERVHRLVTVAAAALSDLRDDDREITSAAQELLRDAADELYWLRDFADPTALATLSPTSDDIDEDDDPADQGAADALTARPEATS